MKYINKEIKKEEIIKLYVNGKTLTEIAKLTGWSRNFLGKLIKDDKRIKEYRNKKVVQVYKQKNQNRISVSISTDFWRKIGISGENTIKDLVDIEVNERDGIITIKKHLNG